MIIEREAEAEVKKETRNTEREVLQVQEVIE